MSFFPPSMPGDFERACWFNSSRDGDFINLEEIRDIILDNSGSAEEVVRTRRNENYTVYGFKVRGITFNVVYRCHSCEAVQVGPPEIVDDTSIRDGVPLSGREGYDLYCTKCKTHLDGRTLKVS